MSTVRAVSSILTNAGVTDHDGRVVSQLVDFACRCVSDVTEEARGLADLAGRQQITRDDMLLAIKYNLNSVQTQPPPRQFVLQLANEKNSQPLPSLRSSYGLRLPPDRYCQLQQNFELQPTEQLQMIAQQRLRDQNEPTATNGVSATHSSGGEMATEFQLDSALGAGPEVKRQHMDDDYDM